MDRGGENMKKPSPVATAIKVVVGLLFIIMAFDMDDSTIAVSLVIGLAFLAWAFLPYRRFQQEMQNAQTGRESPVKRPGIGAVIAKVTFAAVFFIMAFDMDDLSSVLISILLGAVFLFWAWYPFWKYNRAVHAEPESAGHTTIRTADAPSRKSAKRLCPFCGAPMSGDTCEYCGMYSEE